MKGRIIRRSVSIFLTGLLCLFGGQAIAQNLSELEARLDSLKNKPLADPVELSNTYNSLASQYVFIDTTRALNYADEALKIARQANYLQGIAKNYVIRSNYYSRIGNAKKGISFAHQSIDLYESISDTAGIIDANNQLAIALILTDDFETALLTYLNTLPTIYEHEGDGFNLSRAQNNIGYMYRMLKKEEKALSYFKQALDSTKWMETPRNQKLLRTTLFGNIGAVYMAQDKVDSAFSYLNRGLSLAEEVNYAYGEGTNLLSLAVGYQLRGNYPRALSILDRATAVLENIGNNRLLSTAYVIRGDVYKEMDRYSDAINNYTEALDYAKKGDYLTGTVDIYKKLSTTYQQMNRPAKALEFVNRYITALDSLDSLVDTDRIYELSRDFAERNAELRIELIEKDQQVQEAQLQQEQYFRNIILLVIILLIVIIIFIYLAYRTKEKTAEALQEKNSELARLNEEKNYLFRIASHDLKTPLSSLIGLAEMIKIEKDQEDSVEEYAGYIEDESNRMLDMVKTLLNLNAIDDGHNKIKHEEINLSESLKKVIKQFKQRANNKNINLHLNMRNIPETIETDAQSFKSILDNLISNAIKFSPEGRNVYVDSLTKDDKLVIRVKDEGPGVKKNEESELFGKFKKLSTRPTAGEDSSGIGLYITKNLVESLDGNISYEGEEGKGAVFVVEIPLSAIAA